MGEIAPMLGAIFGTKHSSKAAAAKSKSKNAAKKVAVVVHTSSPLAHTGGMDKVPTEHERTRENAKYALRSATDSWVSGHMTTKEHAAVHARAKHVLSGKRPMDFKGPSGERKMKGLR